MCVARSSSLPASSRSPLRLFRSVYLVYRDLISIARCDFRNERAQVLLGIKTSIRIAITENAETNIKLLDKYSPSRRRDVQNVATSLFFSSSLCFRSRYWSTQSQCIEYPWYNSSYARFSGIKGTGLYLCTQGANYLSAALCAPRGSTWQDAWDGNTIPTSSRHSILVNGDTWPRIFSFILLSLSSMNVSFRFCHNDLNVRV